MAPVMRGEDSVMTSRAPGQTILYAKVVSISRQTDGQKDK